MSKQLQIYINIPFRPVKCDACPGGLYPYDQAALKAYAIALKREIAACGADMDDYTVSSVRFGGCTAPIITTRVLRELMAEVREHFQIAPDAQFSLEALPIAMTERLCVGMNYDKLSRICCRLATVHSAEWNRMGLPYEQNTSIANLTSAVKDYPPAALTLDIDYGIPGQTPASLSTTLNRVLALKPDSIRLLPTDEKSEELYTSAADRLTAAGYRRIALREFSLPGREDKFTLDVLSGIDRLGIGAGARSYYDGIAYHNTAVLNTYLDHSADLQAIAEDITPIDEAAAAARTAMLVLTTADGLQSTAVPQGIQAAVEAMCGSGYIQLQNSRYILTAKGIVHSDAFMNL